MFCSLSWHSPRSPCRGDPSRSRPCCASTCSSADSRSAAAASSSSPAGTDTRPSRSAAARTPDLSWLVGKARYLTFTAVVSSSHEYFANVSQLAGHEFRRRSTAIAEVLDASLKKRLHSVLAADPTGRGCFSKYCMTCITTPSVAGRLRILNDLDGREREMHPWVCRIIVGVLERQPRRPPPRRGGVGAVLAVFRGQDTATSAGAGRRAVALSS